MQTRRHREPSSLAVSAWLRLPVGWSLKVVLNTRLSGRANFHLLTTGEMHILTALAENGAGARRATNRSANRRALAASDHCSDKRADAGAGANLRDVIFGRTLSAHAAF